MAKKRRLGRGLADLLAEQESPPPQAAADDAAQPQLKIARPEEMAEPVREAGKPLALLELNVSQIEENPFQPRRDFHDAEIDSLAESLTAHDILQPILVRMVAGRYQLISGDRRLRAAIKAGWKPIPARLREADDRLVAELAIVENLQRKDLNPVEKGLSFRSYLEQHKCTQEELAERLKIDRSTIANLLRLLDLPEPVLAAIRAGEITAGHGRALLPLGSDEQQVRFCTRIQKDKLSVRETEEQVQQHVLQDDGGPSVKRKPRRTKATDSHVAELEQQLKMALGTRVQVRQSQSGRGKITIHFADNDEFIRLKDLLEGNGDSQQDRWAG